MKTNKTFFLFGKISKVAFFVLSIILIAFCVQVSKAGNNDPESKKIVQNNPEPMGPLSITLTPYVYSNGFNISCSGLRDGSIDLQVSGGIGTITYQWSTGETTQDLHNLPVGNYTVTVTDG